MNAFHTIATFCVSDEHSMIFWEVVLASDAISSLRHLHSIVTFVVSFLVPTL